MIELDQLPPHILTAINKENSNSNLYYYALISIMIIAGVALYINSNKITNNENKQ